MDQNLPQNHWGVDKRINVFLVIGLLAQIIGVAIVVGVYLQRVNGIEEAQREMQEDIRLISKDLNGQALQINTTSNNVQSLAARVDRTVAAMDRNNALLQELIREVYSSEGGRDGK